MAAITQLPARTPVTVAPDTVQTLGVVLLNEIALPDPPPVAPAVVVPFTASEAGEKLIAPMAWVAIGVTRLDADETLTAPEAVVVVTVNV